MNIHSSFLPIRSNSFSPVLTHVYCSIEFYDIEKQVGRFPSCGLGLYTLSFSFSTILFLSSADAEYLYNTILYYIIYYLILSQNFSSADAEYTILYYIPPLPVKNFSSADAEYILLYILYPSPVKKINFSAVAAILRQISPKLPQTPPFFPQSPPQKKFFWRLTPPKSQQNPTKSENEKKWPDASVYYILYYKIENSK